MLDRAKTAEKTEIIIEEVQPAPEPASQKKSNESFVETPGVTRIGWKDLEGLDFLTGKMSHHVRKLDNQIVALPGYMVPLADDLESFNEFLIVPDPQACIHFPPPPPNQMLYVKTKKNLPMRITGYPFWFQGKLEVVPTNSQYGRVSYKLILQRLHFFKG
jgi:hypothetical protein